MRTLTSIVLLACVGCSLERVGASAAADDASVPTKDAQPVVDATGPDVPVVVVDATTPDTGLVVDAGTVDVDPPPVDAGSGVISISGGTYTIEPLDAGACSTGGPMTSFKITNQHGTPIDFYWVNNSCAEVVYGYVANGGTATQGTFQNHVWRVRNDSDKAILGEFRLTGPGPYAVVVK